MKKIALIVSCAGVLVVVLLVHHSGSTQVVRQQQSVRITSHSSSKTQGTKPSKTSKPSTPSKTDTSSSPTPASTNGPCSAILDLAAAQKILGVKAMGSASNGNTSQAADLTVTTCIYTAGSDTVSVVEHTERTPIGASSNDIVFGSGRPHDGVSVVGYGSAAFWDPDTNTLSILKDNNWYAVHCDIHSQSNVSSAESIATLAHLAN